MYLQSVHCYALLFPHRNRIFTVRDPVAPAVEFELFLNGLEKSLDQRIGADQNGDNRNLREPSCEGVLK